jgi:hypothetical protein
MFHVPKLIHFSVLRSCQRIHPVPTLYETFRDELLFTVGEGVVSPHQTPRLEYHVTSAVRDCLFKIRSYPPYLEAVSSLPYPQPENAPCCGGREPTEHGGYCATWSVTRVHFSQILQMVVAVCVC